MVTGKDIPNQSGKTATVTGANSGIGYKTGLALYEAGATVIVAARDLEEATKAITEMHKAAGLGSLQPTVLDLSKPGSIKQFADEFYDRHPWLDILINNAGVMVPPPSETAAGYELQFGVNFLGHFVPTVKSHTRFEDCYCNQLRLSIWSY